MRNTTCVVVDDEPIARHGIEKYVSRVEGLECIGVFGNVMQLDRFLHDGERNKEPDIIFIDIKMPGMSGLDYLAEINVRSAVVVVTAYESYALRGYELDVTDYLLKPVTFDRFLKAVNKATAYRQYSTTRERSRDIPTQCVPDSIFVKSDRIIHRIVLSDIVFIEGMENYVKIYTVSTMIVARMTLKGIMASLPEGMFIQTHKSYIINIRHLDSIEGNMLRLHHDHTVPISKNLRQELIRRISG